MANVIKHKRGSGSDPAANNLVIGELAIRTDTGKLFTKMDSGAIAEIAGGGSDIAINTLSSSSGTGGGSATFNGSAYRFTLSAPPSVSAAQLLVSINGVIQKPVTGTGQPSEGFAVDGNDIILGDAPDTGSDFFILTFKSLGVSEPADNSVTSAKIVDGAIVNADINASAAIARTKLANVDLVDDTTPQLGGNLDTNGYEIFLDDNHKIFLGDSNEYEIYHESAGDRNLINSHKPFEIYAQGDLKLRQNTSELYFRGVHSTGAAELYYDNNKKFETTSTGVTVTGTITGTGKVMIGSTTANASSLLTLTESFGNAQTLEIIAASNSGVGSQPGIKFTANNGDNIGGIFGDVNSDSTFLQTGGTARITIDSSGQTGIGTTSPLKRLHIADAGDVALMLQTTNAVDDKEIFEIGCAGNASNHADLIFRTRVNAGTGGSEVMRLTNDANVGIGTSGPKAGLHVATENTTYGKNAVFGANGFIDNANYHYTDATISLLGQDTDGNNKGAGIEFTARNSANNNWRHGAMYMERDGDFVVKADGLGTFVGTEKLRFQSGGGISFNGDTASANALDDYEEGTWTATVNYGNHITSNAAYYTKIGQMVFWHLHFNVTFAPNDTSVFQIYGLPFTSKNVTENYGWTGNIVYSANANNSNIANMRPLVEKNNTYIYFHTVGLGNSARVLNNLIRSALVGNSTLMGGFYMAA